MVILRAAAAGLFGVLAVLFGLSAARAEDRPLILHPVVWEAYQEYAALFRPGAFAVSRDGSIYGYSYCPDVRCKAHTSKKIALESCEESGGENCLVFAFQREIKVAYTLLDLEAAGACPSEPVPEVTIVADMPPVVYDYSYDVESLTAFEKLGKARTSSAEFELLGLAVHDFDPAAETDLRPYIRESAGLVCAGFESSEVHLHMSSQIYVANDFPKGTCLYEEILAHEERHHEVARRLFTEFAADATRRLAEDLRSRPFLQVSGPWEGRSASQARLERAIAAAYVGFIERYEIEQGAIDTTEEYARIANACPDAGRYMD